MHFNLLSSSYVTFHLATCELVARVPPLFVQRYGSDHSVSFHRIQRYVRGHTRGIIYLDGPVFALTTYVINVPEVVI